VNPATVAVPLSRFLFFHLGTARDLAEGPTLPVCATGGRPSEAPPGSRGGLRAWPDLHGGAVAATRSCG
jgi:hypothetical protein